MILAIVCLFIICFTAIGIQSYALWYLLNEIKKINKVMDYNREYKKVRFDTSRMKVPQEALDYMDAMDAMEQEEEEKEIKTIIEEMSNKDFNKNSETIK